MADRESRRTDWLEEHKGKIQVRTLFMINFTSRYWWHLSLTFFLLDDVCSQYQLGMGLDPSNVWTYDEEVESDAEWWLQLSTLIAIICFSICIISTYYSVHMPLVAPHLIPRNWRENYLWLEVHGSQEDLSKLMLLLEPVAAHNKDISWFIAAAVESYSNCSDIMRQECKMITLS